MKRKLSGVFGIAILLITALSCRLEAEEGITHEELIGRTQELFDSVAAADNAPWQKYFADDCLFFDEKGRSFDKATLMNEVGALPEGYRLSFKIEKAQSRIFEDTAVLSYDIDEDLTIFGQQVGARFHTTDTWLRRQEKWQIIASQSFRYYGDPAPGEVDSTKFSEYVGVYELAPGVKATISVEGGNLYHQRGDRPKELLIPEAPRIFFRKGVEGRMLFRYEKDGKVDALISRRNHEDIIWEKIQ